MLAGLFTELIDNTLASEDLLSMLKVQGRAMAKKAGSIPATKVRSILPQPWLLKLGHAVIDSRLRKQTERGAPADPFLYLHGGSVGSQPMDIIFTMCQAVEKGRDNFDKAAIGQTDIHAYYDCLPLGKTLEAAYAEGVDPCTLATAARLHVAVPVVLVVGSESIQLERRRRGVMTGTRSAATLSKFPIWSIAQL